jgi:hypothetical protein
VAVSQISASGFSRNALMVGGDVPVKASNEIVGAIGVSGRAGLLTRAAPACSISLGPSKLPPTSHWATTRHGR